MVKDIESNIQVVDRLEREFLQYTPAGQSYDSGRELVFSFYGVRFFGIMGFRPILRADNMLKKEGRKLMVVDMPSTIFHTGASFATASRIAEEFADCDKTPRE